MCRNGCFFFFFKQKTAYEMRISDWRSDVCSSDLLAALAASIKEKGKHMGRKETEKAIADSRAGRVTRVGSVGELLAELNADDPEIGRASCRERVCQYV